MSLGSRLSGPYNPKSPCTHVAYTLAPMYLNRDYFKALVHTIWVHGPSGIEAQTVCIDVVVACRLAGGHATASSF